MAFASGSLVGNGTTATAPVNPSTISDLFSAINTAPVDFAQSASETALASGDEAEQSAYTQAENIATANARLAQVGGTVAEAQQGLQIRKTLGSQRAAVSAGGFGESGSALAVMRSSTRQGLLQQQITGVNAEEQAAGYQEQGAASVAEGAAAGAAASSASSLAASDAALGTASKTNAINEAAALGVNIPGLGNLSATSIPNVNPVTVGSGTTTLGGRTVSPSNPFII